MNFLLGLARRIEIVSYRASREKESRKQIKLIRENKLYVVFLGLLSVWNGSMLDILLTRDKQDKYLTFRDGKLVGL
jgi:hypothetical protein